MRAAADILAPLIAAGERSKVPFYFIGGALAAWAVLLALFGLTRPDFPGTAARARAVMGISLLLMIATTATAVATSSFKHEGAKEEKAQKAAPAAPGGGGATVQISSDPSGQLKFQQSAVSAKAGKVTIDFTNQAPIPHDVTITAGTGKLGGTKVVSQGKATATVNLKPGTYTFYCSVDAHRQAGMQGKLTVS